RQRPLVQPAFHHETLESIVAHVDVALQRTFANWDGLPADAVADVDDAMMHATLEIVGHALFGTDLSEDAEQLASATLSALDVVIARARVPISPPSWVPTPGNRKLQRSVHRLDSAVARMITARRKQPGGWPHDMLDLLLGSRDESGAGLTTGEIRDQIVTFIVAGHETVASALTWAWALLAANPDVQEDVHRESASVLGGRAPTFEDYRRLPLARAVFDESLRLFPPAWLITRKALADDELAGHAIPAGAVIILSPWLAHRHPALWDEPEEFRPARFVDAAATRSSFIPFGAGPRQCIGRDFANIEGTLMIAAIAGRYAMAYPAGAMMPIAEPLVTIRPVGGLPLRITRRS
ncbi:MAG: cytochrome P450, partial [bacterium]|nr:cytochrome P450 [bacterium]